MLYILRRNRRQQASRVSPQIPRIMSVECRARIPRVSLPLQCGQIRVKAGSDRVRRDAQFIWRVASKSNKIGRLGGRDGTGCFQLLDFGCDGCLHGIVGEATVRCVFDVFEPGDAGWADAKKAGY